MKKDYSSLHSGHTVSAVVCGLDVHKESTYATVFDLDDKVLAQRRDWCKELRYKHALI